MISIILVFISYSIAAVKDIHHRIIPDYIHILLLTAGCTDIFIYKESLLNRVFSLTAFFVITMIIALKSDGLGGGDIKIISSTAFATGFSFTTLTLAVGCTLACIFILFKQTIKKEKTAVPLAPFLAVGVATVFVLKELIIPYLGGQING